MRPQNYAAPIDSLRNYVDQNVKNRAMVEILCGMLLRQESQKSTDTPLNLLLNFPKEHFKISKVVLERIERKAWDELIPEIPLLVSFIESALYFKETGMQLASDFVSRELVTPVSFERDLRGVECPRNYVKANVVLKRLPSGSELTLILDSGTPIENVPMRLKAEGYLVSSRIKFENAWKIKVSKP